MLERLADICARRPRGDDYSCTRLGGVSLYADTDCNVDGVIEAAIVQVRECLREFLLVPKGQYEKCVREEVEGDVDPRVLGAIVGHALSERKILVIPTLTENHKIFRLYMHPNNNEDFDRIVQSAERLLEKQSEVSARQVQQECWHGQTSPNWVGGMGILQYLAYRGRAVVHSNGVFLWPEAARNAVL